MSTHTAHARVRESGFRPEIQALRAIAVTLVLVFHLRPAVLPSGFIGVDVFFVISGFLITGHLLREISVTGGLKVSAFWVRRVRRLMPSALLVLTVSAIATATFVPAHLRSQFLSEIVASATYTENWLLAANSVDYLASENTPSIVQHYWSLSVEEQFYLVLPLLLVGILALLRKFSPRARIRAIIGVLAALTISSFAFSAIVVNSDPSAAYFFTQGRVWEFGVGALVAAAMLRARELPQGVRTALSWAGLVGLGYSMVTITESTPFPGFAALIPVLATAAVIVGGTPASRWAPTRAFTLPPVQWIGKVSYPAYLWHWPLIVGASIFLPGPPAPWLTAAILVATLVLAWATVAFVETPVQRWTPLIARPAWVSFASVGVITAMLLAGCAYVGAKQEDSTRQAAARIAEDLSGDCVGANAIINSCDEPYAVTEITAPDVAMTDYSPVTTYQGCQDGPEIAIPEPCVIGDVESPVLRIALIGDSHASTLMDPLDSYGQQHGWEITVYAKAWCAGTGGADITPVEFPNPTLVSSCEAWGSAALSTIASDPAIDVVIFADYLRGYLTPTENGSGRTIQASDFERAWQILSDAGKTVVVVRDTPTAGLAACVATQMATYDPCPVTRDHGIGPDDTVLTEAADTMNVPYIDLSDLFCDATTCHAVIGGLVVMYDTHHITASFAKTLAVPLGDRISAALG